MPPFPTILWGNGMDLTRFFRRVLPDSGVYYVASLDNNSKFRQKKVSTREEMVDQITRFIHSHKNAYFATGTFNNSREANDAKERKVFFLDMDCGPTKPFPTKTAAVKELVQFIKDSGILTPSLIVDSGNGVHVYWVLKKAVSPKAWLPIATALDTACREYGLQVDEITTDLARVLRAPGTVNYKDPRNPKPCKIFRDSGKDYTIDEIRTSLKKWLNPVAVPSVPAVDGGDLSGGVEYSRTWLAKYIFPECGFLNHILQTGGDGNSEALWQHVLALLAFCEDGHDWIHKVSEGDSRYTHAATERKFQIKVDSATEKKFKPTVCATFEKFSPDEVPDYCSACEHKGEIKSPCHLGKPPPTELPYGFSQNERGIFFGTGEDKEFLIPYQIQDFMVGHDVAGSGLVASFHAVSGGTNYFTEIPHSAIHDLSSTNRILSAAGVALTPQQLKAFGHLMTTWVQQMQAARKVQKTTKAFGWVHRGDLTGFSAGGKTFWADGKTEISILPDKSLGELYTPQGSLPTWSEIANFVIDQGRQEINLAIATAFAAPLVTFTGISGMTLSIVSEKSGTGKSTALKVAQSVWGNPVSAVNALDDTPGYVAKKLGVLNNLPAYWDELRMKDNVIKFIGLLFQLGQGKEKARLTQNIEARQLGTWTTLITVASNESLIDHIDAIVPTSDAGRRRVFEVFVTSPTEQSKLAEALTKFKLLETNFGVAGELYAKYLATHEKEVEAAVHKYITALTKKFAATNDERFWISFMAAILTGAYFAKKLNIANFDTKALLEFLSKEFRRIRNDVDMDFEAPVVRAIDNVIAYCKEYAAHTVVVKTLPKRGNPTYDIIAAPDRLPVHVEYVKEEATLRIEKKHFVSWVYSKGGSPSEILRELAEQMPSLSIRRSTLGKGLAGNVGGRPYVIEMRVDDEKIADYFDTSDITI